MREPNMELSQQTFYLQHGVHSSPIVLTVRLRVKNIVFFKYFNYF